MIENRLFPFFFSLFFLLLLLLVLHIVTHTQRKERGALQFSFASSSFVLFFWNYIHNKRRLYDGKMIRVSKLYSKNESCVCLLAEWCDISTVKMYLQKIIKNNSNYSLKCHSLFPFSISILSFLYIISELLLFEFKTTTHLDECKNGATSNYLIVKLHYNI